MKKISLFKVIVALCICNVYVFTCGVMGVIKSNPAEAADTVTESTDSNEPPMGGTVDFISPDSAILNGAELEFLELRQPSMADKVISTVSPSLGYDPDELTAESDAELTLTIEAEETEEELVLEPTEETEEIPDPPTSTPVSTPASTPASTTQTTPSTPASTSASTPETTTSTPASTPASSGSKPDISGGIPVEDTTTTPPTTTTTTTPESTPEPQPSTGNSEAANEILTVMSRGEVISGNAVDIIAGITQTEVGYTFAPEAIKAQAVAAYTYVQYCNKYGTYPQVVVSNNVADSVKVLVESVIGECIYYNGDIIQSVYCASSAGYTASSINVWGNDYPYLASRYCELDAMYDPNYGRTATFTSADMKSKIYDATGISPEGDPSTWISIDSRVDNVYVGQMTICGQTTYVNSKGKTVKLTGTRFRDTIMNYGIRSHAFDIEYDAATDSFIITTYGYGHGVGLSQNGANALATYLGYDYKQILTFYYSGCEVH
ncbi:MAG: SpoIID/LytB domain-containing protein [Oscillospiraceae bacterium]|nr:SpoIID/LytB domain-containing protein [Oscillospiraceae bacterium]